MKLIEKKCPGCGASLKFDENDTSVTCEYCNKTLYIQRDEVKYNHLSDKNLERAYQFVDEYGKPLVKGVAAFSIGVFVVIFIVFIIVFVTVISKIFDNENINSNIDSYFDNYKEKAENTKSEYDFKLEEIDETSLKTFFDTAIVDLENLKVFATNGSDPDFSVSKKWSKVGAYLLVSKDTKSNILYTIITQTYKNNSTGKETVTYAAVEFKNLKYTDNGIINHSFVGFTRAPRLELVSGNVYSMVYGYNDLELLYNQLIRSKSGNYTIDASEGMDI